MESKTALWTRQPAFLTASWYVSNKDSIVGSLFPNPWEMWVSLRSRHSATACLTIPFKNQIHLCYCSIKFIKFMPLNTKPIPKCSKQSHWGNYVPVKKKMKLWKQTDKVKPPRWNKRLIFILLYLRMIGIQTYIITSLFQPPILGRKGSRAEFQPLPRGKHLNLYYSQSNCKASVSKDSREYTSMTQSRCEGWGKIQGNFFSCFTSSFMALWETLLKNSLVYFFTVLEWVDLFFKLIYPDTLLSMGDSQGLHLNIQHGLLTQNT